jgi:hypothetical protein
MFYQALVTTGLALTLTCASPLAQEVTDYLGVPGPITIRNTEYVLAWSSHPREGYFKQEYLPAGATPESYESMVIVEFLAGDMPLQQVVGTQIAMIEDRKASSDPIANYAIFQNEGEYLLDFVLSAKDAAGEYIIEWNGYRYAEAELDGEGGSILFALSERSYGNDNAEAFLRGLSDFKSAKTNDLIAAPMPELR